MAIRRGNEESTAEPLEPLRYIDLKRATRLEPEPQTDLGTSVRQWWRGVAHNQLSLRVQPVLPEITINGGVITAIDRGETTARSRRALVVGVLGGLAVCLVIMLWVNNVGLLAGTFRNSSLVVTFLWIMLPVMIWGFWFTRRGFDISTNTITIDMRERTATIRWERTDGGFEAKRDLDEMAIGLYPVELRAPDLPRGYQLQSPMIVAALGMETYSLVDRGWGAIALVGDLWITLGIDRTPETLREDLKPLRDAGPDVDEDPTITVRGFGVRTLLRPERERFLNRS